MKTGKIVVLGIIAMFVMIISTGCSKSYTNADIAGTWTNHVLDLDQEWTFNADGTYTETSAADGTVVVYETDDSGKFHFEGDTLFIESDDSWGTHHSFKVKIVDSNTMTWETEAGKIREFKRK